MISFDVDQDDWGSSKVYPDDPAFIQRVKYLVVHWGGGTGYIPPEDEAVRLQIWQNYHIYSKHMKDIAYTHAVGDSGKVYRLRGYNNNGGMKSSDLNPEGDPYNETALQVVWIGGRKVFGGPSAAALESMGNIARESGLIIIDHRSAKVQNYSWTECPGEDWIAWIEQQGWVEKVFTHYQIGVEQPEYEAAVTWPLYRIAGGTVNPNVPSGAMLEPVLGKTNAKLPTQEDFDLLADFVGMDARHRQLLMDDGLYRYGKEIAALWQFVAGG